VFDTSRLLQLKFSGAAYTFISIISVIDGVTRHDARSVLLCLT